MPFIPGVSVGAPESVSLTFGTARDPGERVFVTATVSVYATGGNEARVTAMVNGTERSRASVNTAAGSLTGNPDVISESEVSFFVDEGETYTLENTLDPNTSNAIVNVTEQSIENRASG